MVTGRTQTVLAFRRVTSFVLADSWLNLLILCLQFLGRGGCGREEGDSTRNGIATQLIVVEMPLPLLPVPLDLQHWPILVVALEGEYLDLGIQVTSLEPYSTVVLVVTDNLDEGI